MDMNQVLAAELNVKPWQVEAAVKLIDEGNTIPFISRYRKEATGSLNDEILRNLYDRLMYLRSLNDRKAVVLASIEEQGKLTAELKKSIEEAATLVVVEDLYRPYRPKRRTRATIAKEKGLEPLANIILLQMTKEPLEKEAEAFVSEEKEVKTAKDAIAGACDIIAESISDEADYRMEIRRRTEAKGLIVSTAKDEKAESVYENYYEFSEPVSKIAGHRVLALNRGEKEKFLNVKIEAPTEEILRYLEKKIITKENPQTKPVLQATIEDAYNRLIAPAIERAADRRPGCPWMGPGVPYGMQAGRCRCDWKSARYHRGLPDRADEREEDCGSESHCKRSDPQIRRHPDFCRKRNCKP